MKKLSFVIPSYNCAAFLAHAIESAQKQTYANVEIVVIDDASTDSTPTLMAHYANDKRVVYRRLEKNIGRSAARNLGNTIATGEIILVLDADDIAYPDRAKATAHKMKSADFVYGSCDYIDALGTRLGTNLADVFDKKRALETGLNRITHSTCAYTKELAGKIAYRGGDISDLGIDDWAFQTEVAMSGAKMDFTPSVIGAYRELSTGISRTRDHGKVKAAKAGFLAGLQVGA